MPPSYSLQPAPLGGLLGNTWLAVNNMYQVTAQSHFFLTLAFTLALPHGPANMFAFTETVGFNLGKTTLSVLEVGIW